MTKSISSEFLYNAICQTAKVILQEDLTNLTLSSKVKLVEIAEGKVVRSSLNLNFEYDGEYLCQLIIYPIYNAQKLMVKISISSNVIECHILENWLRELKRVQNLGMKIAGTVLVTTHHLT